MDIDQRFEQAAQEVKTLSAAPDSEHMLKLYALFKQGSKGDCSGARPGILDFVGRAKFDAWAELKGLSQSEAKEKYVALVEDLKAKDGK